MLELGVYAIVSSNEFTYRSSLNANRNVAFKVARMRDSIMEGQDEPIIMKLNSGSEEVGLEDDNKAVLEGVGYKYNADLYIANQEVVYN